MSLHIMYDHQCSKCEAFYIPYEKDVSCPNCGLNEEEIYDIVPQLAHSANYQMDTMGFYTPIAWWTGSFGDYVALIIFQILDAYNNQEEEKEFQEIALDYCNNRTWGNQLYMKDHICNLSHKVYLAIQENKK
ncbi:hypothetical protein [Sulfurimonas gotlandica]|nr:hypothetical protein [Sulfurimonas gotlandica]EDZ63761.1 hypothetical protein CBGD1_1381 [Sulfurimonas gotlandica GD1]